MKINCGGKLFILNRPAVMGILNITPDSFFAGSRCQTKDAILKRTEQIICEGGQIIDVGGYSTRPGADNVSEDQELERVTLAIDAIRSEFKDIPISVDTFRSKVAEVCVRQCGADIINDISGGILDHEMFATAGKLRVPYILMHTCGNEVKDMQENHFYKNITTDIFAYFADKINQLHLLGVNDIILDPGFGFAKDIEQNYELLSNCKLFKSFNLPLLIGISRKRMVWQVIGSDADHSLNGTTALNVLALQQGANILRVHDVKEAVEAVKIFNKYQDCCNNK